MTDLYEIVFENVSKKNLSQLLDVIFFPKILTVTFNSKDITEYWSTCSSLNHLSKMENSDFIFLKLRNFIANNLEINPCIVRILKYNDKFDINLIFEESDVLINDNRSIASILRNFAQTIATEYEIQIFYGGLEPACDHDTRYFSGAELGPLAKLV